MDTNVLYLGDNHDVLQRFSDDCVQMVYLDPPFNSNRDYSVLFKDRTGSASEAQQNAFEDTWRWSEQSQRDFTDLVTRCPVQALVATMEALERIVGHGATLAYLTSMAARLVEMHRVLSPTGSLWLHCDTTASHYLKIVLDSIFGPDKFSNEVIWKRTNAKGNTSNRLPSNHDVLFRYCKGGLTKATWNPQYTPHDPQYVEDFYKNVEAGTGRRYSLDNLVNPNHNRPNLTYEFLGVTRVWRWTRERMQKAYEDGIVIQSKPGAVPRMKRYLDEQEGNPLGDVWDDIKPVQSQSRERLGYPTQKPVALLERIISMSTNEGDIVLDTYCGCGTALVAAHALRRRWIGVDLTRVATGVMKTRLESEYPELALNGGIRVIGDPTDVESAFALADKDKHEFQIWACSLVGAYPLTKKGADGGVDGFLNFVDYDEKVHRAIVQVKGGKNISVKDVREFQSVMTREKATLGFFICLADVKHTMDKEALEAGMWKSASGIDYPRLQVLTVADLMRGKARPRLPVQEKKSILDYKAGRRNRHNTQQEMDMTP